jgi:ribonucleoside-triphosphate reductase
MTVPSQREEICMRSLMSDVKFFEAYSRYDETKKRYETWEEAVERVMNMHREFYAHVMTDKLEKAIAFAEKAYKERRILGAQRALQFGGDQIIRHQMRMYNCTSSYADRVQFFGEFFYILLCGAGAGFSVQKHHVAKLPHIRPRTKQTKEYVIPDSIEGWASALDVLISSYCSGGESKHPEYEGRKVYFAYHQIRLKGSAISGGFKAPGPEPLQLALNAIERLLQQRSEEGFLRPIDVYDICMHASDAVLSGGVRRAATICLFSHDDLEMMRAKTGNWFETNPQRARSNNSAVILRDQITFEEFHVLMQAVREFGEPGFVFVESTEHCFNPCVEIGMYPQINDKGVTISGWQGCNLTEINGSLCVDEDSFLRACEAAAIMGTLQAGYTNFKFLGEESRTIFEREALLGVSVTGWMNNPEVLLDEVRLRTGAHTVRRVNKRVAKLLGINPAARTTCVKPAGNASVLLGTASGVHDEHSRRYIRNMQVNKMQEVCKIIEDMNPYMIEDSIWSKSKSDYVISFPVIPPANSGFKDEITAIDFLDRVKFIQRVWVEEGTDTALCVDPTVRHNVSNTIKVDPTEWEAVAEYLFENRHYFAGVSLLGSSGDKDYFQAPFIEVLPPHEIVERYGAAALFASGLIVDSQKGFKNLWDAIEVARYNHDKSNQELRDIRADWIRRFSKFAETYCDSDEKRAEYCLKDVYLLHKWTKIQQNFTPINIEENLTEAKQIDIDTLGAIACQGGGCQV